MGAASGVLYDQTASTALYDVYRDRHGYGFEFQANRSGSGDSAGWWTCTKPGVGTQAIIKALTDIAAINGARAIFTDVGVGGSFWYAAGGIWYTERPIVLTATPEGSVTADVGCLAIVTTGGATTTLYVKTSGTGNTGWTAK